MESKKQPVSHGQTFEKTEVEDNESFDSKAVKEYVPILISMPEGTHDLVK